MNILIFYTWKYCTYFASLKAFILFLTYFYVGMCYNVLQVKDAEHRLNAARKAHAKIESLYQELKSSGSGMTEMNRENQQK